MKTNKHLAGVVAAILAHNGLAMPDFNDIRSSGNAPPKRGKKSFKQNKRKQMNRKKN